MNRLSFRPWIFQLNTHEIYCNLKLQYFKQKILFRGINSKSDPKVLALRDKLIHCDYLDLDRVRIGYKRRIKLQCKERYEKTKTHFNKLTFEPVFSVLLNDKLRQQKQEHECSSADDEKSEPLYMPYAKTDSYKILDNVQPDNNEDKITSVNSDVRSDDGEAKIGLNRKYVKLYEKYLQLKERGLNVRSPLELRHNRVNNTGRTLPEGELWKVPRDWMYDYEEYDNTPIDVTSYKSYGTPDPNSKVSSVPCGGCGALLHSKDPAIPGYLPSEIFLNKEEETLKSMICQRCHFLKYYNAALKVNVSIEDYPKLLSVIKGKKCAVIVVVDLTDFPCSIWPDFNSVLHPLTPIFLVGNKVDLLPKDSNKFFENVKQLLLDTFVNVTGVNRSMVMHVELASAKTGYGIERLINKLQHKWRHKGDVYLVGCTNVGKSSLFNTLLNSDYCKVQAIDLVQRATVSPWPGTTLNLLKFPLLNPTPKRRAVRAQRLSGEQAAKIKAQKDRSELFKQTRNIKIATLEEHVGLTFAKKIVIDKKFNILKDNFSESYKLTSKPTLDESLPEYKESRWCYDTPGTVHKDQILDLLTTDELVLTLPKITMSPRTFNFKPKQTVFLAGIGRLDYVQGDSNIRCTLFMSCDLPITMCRTEDAEEVYDKLLESEAFVVPKNDPERLKVWPKLESKEFQVTGISSESVADVVLSNAGWVAITPQENETVVLRGWTPEGRGIYLRTPALLRKSVLLRGWQAPGSPMYLLGRQARP